MAKKVIIVQKTIVEIQYVKRTALTLIIIFLPVRLSCGLCKRQCHDHQDLLCRRDRVHKFVRPVAIRFEERPYERYHTVSLKSNHFIRATGSSVEYTFETLRRRSK